jgi:pectate lyase
MMKNNLVLLLLVCLIGGVLASGVFTDENGIFERAWDLVGGRLGITGETIYEVSDGSLPAFPGAEGMGAASIGGRGGTVYIVDTLSDNPANGSTFREAVEASGPRIVVFNVSGLINLQSKLFINNPYITIAGQTSPGGIALVGKMVAVQTHDVVITHMRFRPGHFNSTDPEQERAFEVNGCDYIGDLPACNGSHTTVISYNIILDHCSFSWAPDSITDVHNNAQDVTFSWCFITYPLRNASHPDGAEHALGFFIWGKDGSTGLPSTPPASVSLHHSFIGYSQFRVPENNYNSFLDSVNNVAYYWQTAYTAQVESATGRATSNIIGTYRKTGGSDSVSDITSAEVLDYTVNVLPNIYMYGVIDGQRTLQNDSNQWSTQQYWHTDQPLNTSWRRDIPWPTTGYSGLGIPVTASIMNATYASEIVSNAGATRPVRDGVDTLAIQGYNTLTGSYTSGADVDTLSEVIALINLTTSPTPPVDLDSDGMGDAWENSTFRSTVQVSSGDYDSDGYTNIEEYLFYLGEYTTSDVYPTTTLNSPQNSNIMTNMTITFNCSATDDNKLQNVTLYGNWSSWHANETKSFIGISNSTTFTKVLSAGNYKWNCLACDNVSQCDFGNSNYTFVISDGSVVVSWNSSLWNMSETTNFSSVNLSNFSSVFRNSFGKIRFLENISIARSLDLSGVIVGNRFVYLNSSSLPEFNVSANLSIFNLSFVNPYVLRDGVNCTSCSGLNYLNGTLNFSVVGFSNYSASESPTCLDGVQNGGETGVDCGGVCSACVAVEVEVVSSSGGGGGGSDVVADVGDEVLGVLTDVVDGVVNVLNGSENESGIAEEEVAFDGDGSVGVMVYWIVGVVLVLVLVGVGIGVFVWKRNGEIDRKVYESR